MPGSGNDQYTSSHNEVFTNNLGRHTEGQSKSQNMVVIKTGDNDNNDDNKTTLLIMLEIENNNFI